MKGLLAMVATIVALGAPGAAHAAVCADYPNQAAAQKAHDTVDADHDGIYCEALPCPCSTARPGSGSRDKSTGASRPKVGRSVNLRRRTRGSHCRLRGPLPDRRCTPGSVFSTSTPRLFCKSGYTRLVRHVAAATKRKIYAAYGITSHHAGQYEIDHLVPLDWGVQLDRQPLPRGRQAPPGLSRQRPPGKRGPRPRLRRTERLPQRAEAHRVGLDSVYVDLIGPLPAA